MLECLNAIESYCSAGDVDSDERILDAVLRRLQLLTESSAIESLAARAGCLRNPGGRSSDSTGRLTAILES